MRRSLLGLIRIATLAGAAALAGCGTDGGAGRPPDAAPVIPDVDPAEGTPGEGDASAWYRLSCSVDETADAGPEADAGEVDAGGADAGPAVADAGPIDALDQPCCDPTGICADGYACLQDKAGGHGCRPTCDLATGACPGGGVCASFGGEGVCVPAAAEGEGCDPELCVVGTICVGSSADDATCHRKCTPDGGECADGQTCSVLGGTTAMACI